MNIICFGKRIDNRRSQRNEFDWNTTLKFISNRNNFSFGNVIKLYEDRSYKIKILIKELPTYVVLYKRQRQINGIEEDICLRCNKFREDWEHVWLCEANEEENFRKNREWELLRGVYNHNFNKISKRKDYKRAIENLWYYEHIRLKKYGKKMRNDIRNRKRKRSNEKGFKEKEKASREGVNRRF
ncbi:hypothetical protein RhiirC2_769788 [Rhizophagus irregularis]|uniref:Uncharacterized protein n=1 Tax=Rhizophagus irregularis TaxID=588596 RepID=A0A2N1NY67_9GLOM|nr:hypothetical protein RhiirC2_769788 [Rhizophagus irregularis]